MNDSLIDPAEIVFETYHASGPGGQNVNKVATAVRLRFDLRRASLPDGVKLRLARLAGRRLTDDGVLIIEAQRFRTQERNQQDAIERLETLVRRAMLPVKVRRPTRPTRLSVEKRLQAKRHRSQTKRARRMAAEVDG